MIRLLIEYFPALLQGLGITVALSVTAWAVGMGIGIPLGALVGANGGAGRMISRVGAVVAGALPVLVVLFWFHYPMQALLHLVIEPFYTTAFVLSLLNVVFVTDAVARAVESMPSEWADAGRVLGLSPAAVRRQILIPLGMRQIIGPVLFIQIGMLHATLFGSLISVEELFRVTQRINSIEYDPVSSYSLLVIFFLVVCAPIHIFATVAARRSSRDLSVR